jgi:ABC-type transport system involved in cytochrome c biogenesis permease subunit
MRQGGQEEPPVVSGGCATMLDFVQQLVSGVALGCVYGLIALGFVLVYKATEVVNFAQGDLMMLGGFFAFTFIGMMGLNYWVGFAGAVAAMALFGMLNVPFIYYSVNVWRTLHPQTSVVPTLPTDMGRPLWFCFTAFMLLFLALLNLRAGLEHQRVRVEALYLAEDEA